MLRSKDQHHASHVVVSWTAFFVASRSRQWFRSPQAYLVNIEHVGRVMESALLDPKALSPTPEPHHTMHEHGVFGSVQVLFPFQNSRCQGFG